MIVAAETTLYIGGLFEKVTKPSGVIESRHYILAGKDAIAIKTQRSSAVNDVRYLHKDHLGSVDVITNEAGAVVQRLSYDAFGKRRNAATWSGVPGAGDWTNIAALTHRGFTFHEGLDNVDLVHMNGRVYDPNIGRFLSADPFIQAPLMSQSLNRYSYVMNNPLSLIDPSGYSWLGNLFKRVWNAIRHSVNVIVSAVLYVAGAIVGGPLGVGLAKAASAFLFSPIQVRKDRGGYSASLGYHFGGGIDRGPFEPSAPSSGSPGYGTPTFNPVLSFGPMSGETASSILARMSLPNWLVDEFAAVGDALTFGLTRIARESTGIGSVDTTSTAYASAYWTTTAAMVFASGGTAALIARAGQVVRVVAERGITKTVKTRPTPGRDGATSEHVIERLDGDVLSVTHRVTKEGDVLHQHQTHIGRYGSERRFPDEWIEYPTIPKD